MAITSHGYTGTIEPNAIWAGMQQVLGSQYVVVDAQDCRVTPLTGGTRQVQISAGVIGGQGIRDKVSAPEIVTLPVPVGDIQYFVIVARRNWATSQTTFTYVSAGTSRPDSLPAALKSDPGVEDDQPLAIVSLASGVTTPAPVWDLRCVGGQNEYHLASDTPLELVDHMADVGVRIRQGNVISTRIVNAAGNADWERDPQVKLDNIFISGIGQGWGLSGTNSVAIIGNHGINISLTMQVNRAGPSIYADNPQGGIADSLMGRVSSGLRPPRDLPITAEYFGDQGATYHGGSVLRTNGDWVLQSLAPNSSVRKGRIVTGHVDFNLPE